MSGETQAFPLQWPAGVPRSKSPRQSQFGDKTIAAARDFLMNEIRRMHGTLPVLSSNLELRNDGLPYANQKKPSDPAVAVYFRRGGKSLAFACDQWSRIEHNIYAIGKTIEAMRGIERWGSADLMERAFSGFESLPAPDQWRQILGVPANATKDEISAAYRAKARAAHPDLGGSDAAMSRLNAARDAGLAHPTEKGPR